MSTFPVLKTVRILLSDVNGEKKSSVFIILSALCYELCSSLMVKVVGDFYDAVLNQSATKFLKVLLFSLVVITAVASFKALKTYFAERSALMWRVSLNSLMLDEIEYCEFISLDNFEQRISQDNERLCIIIAKLVEDGAVAPFVIIYYTYYLWLSFGWVTPLICYTYFLIGFVSSFWLVDGISSIVYRQEFFEGTYRFCIGQYLRDISSISLLKGKELEFETINKKFLSLVSNKDALLYRRLKFHLINNCYDYFGAIVNYAAVGLAIFSSANSKSNGDSGTIIQLFSSGAFACLYLINSLSTVVKLTESVSEANGLSTRILETFHNSDFRMHTNCIKCEQALQISDEWTTTDNCEEGSLLVHVEHLQLLSEDHSKILINSLNLDIFEGMRVLITGSVASGKSTLIRLLARDSTQFSGDILWNIHSQDIVACPQNPYCFMGTVAENLAYPAAIYSTNELVDHQTPLLHNGVQMNDNFGYTASRKRRMAEVLKQVGLSNLVDLLDEERSSNELSYNYTWMESLTNGERQRLAVARALFHRPKMVLLDEITSSVDENSESVLYTSLVNSCPTIISTGHRSSLFKFHTHQININQDGSYELKVICADSLIQ